MSVPEFNSDALQALFKHVGTLAAAGHCPAVTNLVLSSVKQFLDALPVEEVVNVVARAWDELAKEDIHKARAVYGDYMTMLGVLPPEALLPAESRKIVQAIKDLGIQLQARVAALDAQILK